MNNRAPKKTTTITQLTLQLESLHFGRSAPHAMHVAVTLSRVQRLHVQSPLEPSGAFATPTVDAGRSAAQVAHSAAPATFSNVQHGHVHAEAATGGRDGTIAALTTGRAVLEVVVGRHGWSSSKRCFRQTFWPHVLHSRLLLNVNFSLQPCTGQRALGT